MTEVAIRAENTAVAPVPAQRALPQPYENTAQASPLARWVDEAARAEQLAARLAGTSFVPASMRGKPVEVMAAILAGIELGFQPMAALRSMDVIQGTPALRAHAMRGLVQSHGHEVELVGDPTAELVVMRGRRRGAEKWQQVKWDIPRAAKLGLLGKPEYKRQLMTMLIARATGEICRLVASDVIYAMPYAAEELDGDTLPDGRPFAEPRVTADEVLGQVSAPGETRPDYCAMAQAATSIEQWREVWNEASSAGHLDDDLKQRLTQRGQELKEAAAAPAVDPGSACGWCEESGHHEDECPRRGDGDDYAETVGE